MPTRDATRALRVRSAPGGRPRDPVGDLPGVVFGGHVTALGVVRSLHESRIPSYIVCPPDDYAGRSRWSRRLDGPPESPAPEPLRDFLESLPLERALLFPCSDDWARAAAALPEEVRARFPVPVPELEVLEGFLDKAKFAGTVRSLAIPHPATVIVERDGESALDGLSDLLGGRLFLKPTDSQAFVRRFGVKALTISSLTSAREHLAEAWAAGMEAMMVQEYVPGPASSHYFLDGFVGADGAVVACLARRRLRMYPPDFGNSTFHVTVPLDEVAPAYGDLRRLLDGVGYRGIFSAEFKRDERDGVLRILEVNARPWWYVHFAAVCGVNVCELAHREALGYPPAPSGEYEVGRRSVLYGADLRAYRHQRGPGGVGLPRWLASWRGAKPAVFDARDPLPALVQLRELLARRLARRRTGNAPAGDS
jgi:D-aspartate ligase